MLYVSKGQTGNDAINVVFNLVFGPGRREADPSRMKDVFPDGEFGDNNIILGDVANKALVLLHVFIDTIHVKCSGCFIELSHEDMHKGC
jgi:hypothetical protein